MNAQRRGENATSTVNSAHDDQHPPSHGTDRLLAQSIPEEEQIPISTSSSSFVLSDRIVRAIFLLLGVGILIPWNAFVSAKPYFAARLCQGEGQKDIINFEQWFGLVWNLSSVLSLGLIIVGQAISDYYKKRKEATTTSTTTTNALLSVPTTTGGRDVGPEETSSRGSSGGGSAGTGSDSIGSHDHSLYLVMVPLFLYMTVFMIQAGLVLVPNIPPQHFLMLTMVGLAVCGTCGAVATAGIVSTAGLFPSNVGINPFFSGQALGGVAVSLANFATALFQDPSVYWDQHCTSSFTKGASSDSAFTLATTRMDYDGPNQLLQSLQQKDVTCSPYTALDWAIFAYFGAGCIVLLLCLLGYHQIHKYQDMAHRDDYEVIHDTVPSATGPEVVDESPRIGLELNDRISERQSHEIHSADGAGCKGQESSLVDDTVLVAGIDVNASNANDGVFRDDNNDDDQASIDEVYTNEVDEGAVFAAIKGPATCIFLVFTVTLCLFPSWVSELESSQQCASKFRLHNDLYVPFSFVFFNVGDLLGRMLAGRVKVERIRHLSRKLVIAAVLRVCFFPLFLLCQTSLTSHSGSNSLTIPSDIFSGLVQFGFAVTNGLLVSMSFMWAPHLVGQTTQLQERASEMMTFAVYFGLLGGSMLAFPFLQLATRILTQ